MIDVLLVKNEIMKLISLRVTYFIDKINFDERLKIEKRIEKRM